MGGSIIIRMGEELDLLYLLERVVIINEKIFRNRILKNENYEVEKEFELWFVVSLGIENIVIDFYCRCFVYEDDKILD